MNWWIVIPVLAFAAYMARLTWNKLDERYVLPEIKPPSRPVRTEEMRRMGLMWAKAGDEWIEVCDTCGGNCGQCGITGRVGNVPFNMNYLIKETGMDKPVAGFPRPR